MGLIERIGRRYREIVRDKYQAGEVVPWWKGYVTESFSTRRVIVAPLGFNVLFYFAFSFWLFVSRVPVGFDRFRRDQAQMRANRP